LTQELYDEWAKKEDDNHRIQGVKTYIIEETRNA